MLLCSFRDPSAGQVEAEMAELCRVLQQKAESEALAKEFGGQHGSKNMHSRTSC